MCGACCQPQTNCSKTYSDDWCYSPQGEDMAAKPVTLRLKTKAGQHVVNHLTSESTINDLKTVASEHAHIPSAALRLLSGFPPKPVDITDGSKSLHLLNIRHGDTVIVEEDSVIVKEDSVPTIPPSEVVPGDTVLRAIQSQYMSGGGILTRQVVPANNSCLFTAFNLTMKGGRVDLTSSKPTRDLIATIVASDPLKYNDAFLGKCNAEYCSWIRDSESWGGAIEVSILSAHYSVEICVVDTQAVRINRFGEDQHYKERVLLIYDGIHYDCLVFEPADPTLPAIARFPTSDNGVLSQAMELAAEAKSSRQYTDVKNLSLKCLVCGKGLGGPTDAQTHAKDTGHINFGEM